VATVRDAHADPVLEEMMRALAAADWPAATNEPHP
jgi:hypothetical protein